MKRSKKTMDVYRPRKSRSMDDVRRKSNTSYRPGHPHTEPTKSTQLEADKPRKSWKKRLAIFFFMLFLLIIIPLLVIGIWDLRNFSRASQKLFGTSNALGLLATRPLETTDGRTNILLTGYSVDDPGHGGAELTDSILILSVDQTNKSGYMLSVPRDLFVEIPGYGSAKINEAYQAGQQMNFQELGFPSGGMGLLEKVVEDHIGLDIHYYALLNYTAVRETVDALGGITIEVKSDDPRGLHDPSIDLETGEPLVNLPNGPVTLTGRQALNLTRARGAGAGSYGYALSDFTRTQNQQAVFRGIQNKLSWKLVLDPRTNQKVFDAAANNVKTDVEISEVLPLYRMFTSVPSDEIKTYTLRDINGQNLLTGFTTRLGQSALIPATGVGDFSEIQAAVEQLK
jgi:polyisoprenyl-teichoic acid--peptidoglycan teichoic acid transferase